MEYHSSSISKEWCDLNSRVHKGNQHKGVLTTNHINIYIVTIIYGTGILVQYILLIHINIWQIYYFESNLIVTKSFNTRKRLMGGLDI